ncbi:helix-turn-helix domain-containing protein [Janibacter sp. G349]|uniref:helix-turn-helix transcriptional regulator n=1 Tax=Janibacter sp. G349 TaxID=3405424 RepID=UPI003B788F23
MAGPATVDVDRQRHPVHMALVLEGACRLRQHDGTVVPLPHSTLLIEPTHATIEVLDGARLGLVSFLSVASGPGLLETAPGLRQLAPVDASLTRVTEVVMAWVLAEPPTGTFARHIIDRTLRDLIGGLILDSRLRPVTAPEQSLYSAVLHHIADHYADADLGPESIAAAFNVSPRHLARAFQEEATTITASIASTRVSVAAALIGQQPELGLAEVSAKSGFSSLQAMRRAFRADGRNSPSALRTLSAQRHRAANRSRRDADGAGDGR